MNISQLVHYAEFLHNVPNLSELDIHGYDISEDQTLPELLKHIYEWEYKYSIIQGYNIPSQRKDNMLTKIEEKISPCIDVVASVLKETYDAWLQYHDTSDPDAWSQKWKSDHEDFGDDNNAKLAAMWTTYNSSVYESESKKITDLDYAVCDDGHIINNYIQIIVNETGQDIEDVELAQLNIMQFINYITDCGYSIQDIIDGMYNRVIMTRWDSECNNLDFYVKGNYAVLDDLNSISSQNFLKKIATLSIALNGVHSNGLMLDHVQYSFPDIAGSLSVEGLSALSETDDDTIRKWEAELQEGL